MADDRIERLTDRQRECLRLVAAGYQVKEIALRLGLTPDAVRERLRAARETLDLTSSRAAARLLVDSEAAAPSAPGGLPPAELHTTYMRDVEAWKGVDSAGRLPPPEAAVAMAAGDPERPQASAMHERQTAYQIDRQPPVQAPVALSGWLGRRRPNDRDTGQRILLILQVAALLAVLFWGGAAAFVYESHALADIVRHGG